MACNVRAWQRSEMIKIMETVEFFFNKNKGRVIWKKEKTRSSNSSFSPLTAAQIKKADFPFTPLLFQVT